MNDIFICAAKISDLDILIFNKVNYFFFHLAFNVFSNLHVAKTLLIMMQEKNRRRQNITVQQ